MKSGGLFWEKERFVRGESGLMSRRFLLPGLMFMTTLMLWALSLPMGNAGETSPRKSMETAETALAPTTILSREHAYMNPPLNVFPDNDQCTSYVYGRVLELAEAKEIDPSNAERFRKAFKGKHGRHATNWPNFLQGEWWDTNKKPLPREWRRPGVVLVWRFGKYGHVALVEEVSEDRARYRISEFNLGMRGEYGARWLTYGDASEKMGGVSPSYFRLKEPV